ncbi:hypothetical protein [Taklimakanibacter deserti]|uniref:hypothetical protein n=1 Tax=Taklimakanibacter deserti TaxID=2267839 RepID=UPI0013C4C8F6
MTLVLTIQGREAVWLLADRRLSFAGRLPRDDGRKVMCLETSDGVAIVGYAGLGSTTLGTEPADWMVSVLRGRNLPLEESLGTISRAVREQFPRHLQNIPKRFPAKHAIVATAFVGDQVRCYSIEIELRASGEPYFLFTRHMKANAEVPVVGVAGSGMPYILRSGPWRRPLLRLVRSYDKGKVHARTVADQLAKLNDEVHNGTPDGTVGPRCVVVWRNRVDGIYQGGGGHQFFISGKREREKPPLPSISCGMDVEAVFNALLPHMKEHLSAALKGKPTAVDEAQIHADLAKLPDKPDERLR